MSFSQYLKRTFDLGLAVPAFFLFSPIFLGIVICVRLYTGRNIFFTQFRPGRYGKPFKIYKFRTMADACDTNGKLLPDSDRLTTFGKFLRSTSLDELPELFNVIRGEMSIVGPRPLLMQYLERYSQEQARRHEVKPGLTGWAQINGRNTISWEEKFELDVWYVDNQSFWLDLKIIALTVKSVLKREGISAEGGGYDARIHGSRKAAKALREKKLQKNCFFGPSLRA